MTLFRIVVLALVCVLAWSCDSGPKAGSPGTNDAQNKKDEPPPSDWTPELDAAFREWNKAGKYRVAKANDFKFSEAARKKMGADRYARYVNEPYIKWSGAYGAIVIDQQRSDPYRFGLIIFRQVEGKEPGTSVLEPSWYCEACDLSRTGLERGTSNWQIVTYDDAGARQGCSAEWDPKSKKIKCT